LLSTTQIRQVSGRSRNREASTTRSLSLFLSVSLARTRASGSAARPPRCQGASAAGAQSRALAAPSFSGPLHRTGTGIPAGTDEMCVVLHPLSHGASWRTFDFLGFNVRRYGVKLLIKPSKAAVRRIRERLRTELRSLRGTNAPTVIKKLNPIIRGWAAYYRTQVSSEVFGALDGYLWQLTFKWARFSHANKPTRWVVARYYARFNKSRRDRWVFGDRKSGAYMHKFAWTSIVRHQMVKGASSPDDPALADYWAKRRRKTPLPIDKTSRWLLKAQDGQCPICRNALLFADDRPQTPREWEQWLATTRKTITKVVIREDGSPAENEPRLIHARCRNGSGPGLLPAYEPVGLA
jgi:RNA-directed DNA polymerase